MPLAFCMLAGVGEQVWRPLDLVFTYPQWRCAFQGQSQRLFRRRGAVASGEVVGAEQQALHIEGTLPQTRSSHLTLSSGLRSATYCYSILSSQQQMEEIVVVIVEVVGGTTVVPGQADCTRGLIRPQGSGSHTGGQAPMPAPAAGITFDRRSTSLLPQSTSTKTHTEGNTNLLDKHFA